MSLSAIFDQELYHRTLWQKVGHANRNIQLLTEHCIGTLRLK